MEDCKKIVFGYLTYKDLFALSRENMYLSLPSTVTIHSYEEYEQFKKWCNLFTPSNITTVTIYISHPSYFSYKLNNTSYRLDYVPACVKNVDILRLDSIAPFTTISLPDTVEYLKVSNTYADIYRLPANIRHLVLGYGYQGGVNTFDSNLEMVELYGYDSGGRYPCQINDLPDTIHTIKMYAEFPGQINYWPVNAKVIVEDPYERVDWNYPLLNFENLYNFDNIDLFNDWMTEPVIHPTNIIEPDY
jgi:hypothetical protein